MQINVQTNSPTERVFSWLYWLLETNTINNNCIIVVLSIVVEIVTLWAMAVVLNQCPTAHYIVTRRHYDGTSKCVAIKKRLRTTALRNCDKCYSVNVRARSCVCVCVCVCNVCTQ